MPNEVWLGEKEQQEFLEAMAATYSYVALPMLKIIDGKTKYKNLSVRRVAAKSCLRLGFTITDKSVTLFDSSQEIS